ncbi:MAG: AI-2E family transporter [Thermomicrobiales bacterium]
MAQPTVAKGGHSSTRRAALGALRRFRHGPWWWTVGAVAVALLLAFGLLATITVIAQPLLLLLAAIIIGEALAPIVDWFDRWLLRPVAIALVYLLILGALALAGWLILPVLIAQTQRLAASVPDLVRAAQQWLGQRGVGDSAQVGKMAAPALSRGGDFLAMLPLLIFNSALDAVAVVFMSVYWLVEAPALKRFILSLFPARSRAEASAVLHAMGRSMGGYIRGVVLNALIIGGLAIVGLLVIGVEFPLVLGALTMLGELAPILGPFLAAVPAVIVGFLHSPTQALIVLGFYVALEQLEGHLVTPNVMRSQTDVPQLLILFALFAGIAFDGALGAFVAIPLAGALRVLILRVVAPAIRRWSGAQTDADEAGSTAPEGAT